MKAAIDMTKCSGHARCHATDPDLFQIDEFHVMLVMPLIHNLIG